MNPIEDCERKGYDKPVKRTVCFSINGQEYELPSCHEVSAETSLNTFIRRYAKLPGTKFMCLEAGCGACTVSLRGIHPVTKEFTTWAVNSCVFPVYSCHGLEVITIEGIGNKKDGYHDLQKRLAKFNGTQCGFCSPGMVMNMYSLMEGKQGDVSMKDVENSFSGNICRCTGYRPILDAFKSVAVDATQELKDVCGDIEDLSRDMKCLQVCKKQTTKCDSGVIPVHISGVDGKEWYKPYTVKEILDIFQQIGTAKYILVHGNTAHGVYRRDPEIKIFIDITGVDTLHQIQIGTNLVYGGNVSITETMNALLKAADQNSDFEYCREVWKHLNLVANVPVRNNGTLAGNLSLKHDHNEFQSDIFLLLETVGAILEVQDVNESTRTLKPKDFLSVDMTKKIITKITLPPLPISCYIFRSYKIMPRAQNSPAYVNAGILMKLDKQSFIQKATIVYGGISPTFIHASKTETYLQNRNPFENETLAGAVTTLRDEISPDYLPSAASQVYRKNLAISLFYKFILNVSPQGKLNQTHTTGGILLERPLSSGIQDFDSDKSKWPLNQNVPKLEALIQCSGEAQYVNDIPPQPLELCAAFVVATEIGSTVVGFNTDAAMSLPGVRHFFSAKDIPGENNFFPLALIGYKESEEIFCSGKVLFNGQPVGMILADSMELANRAASMVQVQYRASDQSVSVNQIEKKPVLGLVHPVAAENIKINGHFEKGGQYHFTMETQSALAIPNEDCLDVYPSTQTLASDQTVIAKALNLPSNAINISVKRIGGGFGSKISRSGLTACAAALGAHLTNRPVRLVLTIERNMESIGKRCPFGTEYEVEVNNNGKICQLSNRLTIELGCSTNEDLQLYFVEKAMSNCYDPDVMQNEMAAVLTDSASNTWFRAPGTLDGITGIEVIMEHIAWKLGKDPVEVRLQNIPENNPIKELMGNFLASIDYRRRQADIETFNLMNRWRKKGIACVPMQYQMEYFGLYHGLVSIYHGDGTVAITHGGIEMGQGINTKVAQVAAYTLQIPLEMVKVKATAAITSPNNFTTGTSVASEAVCYAVAEACEILRLRLKPYLAKHSNWKDAVFAAAGKSVDLAAIGTHDPSKSSAYTVYGCAAAEVEVDLLTGNYVFHRVDIWEDVGESLSPGVDVGQVEGAFVIGMGLWLTEELIYDKHDGKLLTNRPWMYHVPMAKDIPVDFRIHFLKNRPNPAGVLRSKATGEPAICMAIVCLFALRNALSSARKNAGFVDEYLEFDLPATPEKVFLAAASNVEHFAVV